MITKNFTQALFINATNTKTNLIRITTAYISPYYLEYIYKEILRPHQISLSIIIGNKTELTKEDALKKIIGPTIHIYQNTRKIIHSKMYIWYENTTPIKAFTGSANFTENGMEINEEILTEINEQHAHEQYEKYEKMSIQIK